MVKRSRLYRHSLRVLFVIGLMFIASGLITIGNEEPPRIIIPSFEQRLLPVRIELPSGEHVNVVRAQLTDGTWYVDETQGNYLSESAALGTPGNVVMYGHNFPHIFGSLDEVKIGELVRVTDQNEVEYRYQIEHITEVDPSDTSWIQPTAESTLTLYTCSGFLDSKRLIVRAIAI